MKRTYPYYLHKIPEDQLDYITDELLKLGNQIGECIDSAPEPKVADCSIAWILEDLMDIMLTAGVWHIQNKPQRSK